MSSHLEIFINELKYKGKKNSQPNFLVEDKYHEIYQIWLDIVLEGRIGDNIDYVV